MHKTYITELIKTRHFLLTCLFIVIGIVIFFSIRGCQQAIIEKKIAEQNFYAQSDSTRIERDRANKELSVRLAYMAESDKLKSLNKELGNKLVSLKGAIKLIQQSKLNIQHDTIHINNEIVSYPNKAYGLSWKHYSENNGGYRTLEGESKFSIVDSILLPGETTITKDETYIILYTGLRQINDKYEIFATTDYPNVKFELEGSIIDPKNNSMFNFDGIRSNIFDLNAYANAGISTNNTMSGSVGLNADIHIGKFAVGPFIEAQTGFPTIIPTISYGIQVSYTILGF